MKNKRFKMIGVYMSSIDDFDSVFNSFIKGANMYTGYPVSRVNKAAFMTYNKEVYAFVTTKDIIANKKFDAVFIDNSITEETIDNLIKPTLINKRAVYRY